MTIADVTPPPTAEPTLSQAMRTGSRAEHEAAESSTFMAELLDGRISERGYAAYLLRLRAVYATLEALGVPQAFEAHGGVAYHKRLWSKEVVNHTYTWQVRRRRGAL